MLIKLLTTQFKFILITVLPLISVVSLSPLQVKAENEIRVSPPKSQLAKHAALDQDKRVTLTQGRGQAPGRRRGGGRRDDCPRVDIPLTAIVPQSEDTAQNPPVPYVGTVTTAEHPTFWFYVPYTLSTDLTAEFVLQDQAGTELYKLTSIDLPDVEQTPGIIGVSLPDTVSLEIGKSYEWYFKVNCGSEIPIYTNGGVERISPDESLSQQLANASPQEQARLYQENGVWYDAITVLGNLRRSHPGDVAVEAEWNRLLQTLGIADIVTATSSSP